MTFGLTCNVAAVNFASIIATLCKLQHTSYTSHHAYCVIVLEYSTMLLHRYLQQQRSAPHLSAMHPVYSDLFTCFPLRDCSCAVNKHQTMVGQRASFVLLASAVLISISLVSVRAQSTPSAAVDLRVACRKGQPPFIDAPTGTAASCQGLLLELFKVVVARTGWNYTLDVVESSALEPFIQVNATTNTSRYDLILAFHTITPSQ